jgi:branched-chain amino acid transport system substrate-binding protein
MTNKKQSNLVVRSAAKSGGGAKGTGRDLGRRSFLAGAGGAVSVLGGLYSGAHVTRSASAAGLEGPPVKIGSSVPLTGFAAADGEDMMRGFDLALEEMNGLGGICGRPVEHIALDAGEFAPDVLVNNFKRLITEHEVDVILGGYQLNTGPEYDVVADAGMLYYHNNTIEANAETVRNNPEKYWMVFQNDPTERWYSLSLPGVLDTIEASGEWEPINHDIAIINANNSYSAGLTKALQGIIESTPWRISMIEEIIAPLTEWGPTLAKIRENPPAVIWVTDYFAGDLASFTKQFTLDPTPSLLHEQYGPSVPEFMDIARDAANGVMWASVIAIILFARGKALLDRYGE